MTLGFYINNKGCYGCKTCSMACLTTKIPGNRISYLRHVRLLRSDKTKTHAFLSMACNHCERPACMANCPQDAIEKLDNGIVRIKENECIACGTCVEVCPYGAPIYDEEAKKVYKCDLCYDRIENAEIPLCVEACPGLNLEYGELDDLKAKYPDAVQDINGFIPDSSKTNPSILIGLDKTLK